MRIQQSIIINTKAHKVWEILWENYGQVCEWASTVNASDSREIVGNHNGGRTCTSTWGEISEIVEKVDVKNRTYTYYADGLPKIMKRAMNTWTVYEKGEHLSEVAIDLDIEFAPIPKILMGWMMIPKMKKDIAQTLEDLKFFMETGKQTATKKKSDEKFFKKHPKRAA